MRTFQTIICSTLISFPLFTQEPLELPMSYSPKSVSQKIQECENKTHLTSQSELELFMDLNPHWTHQIQRIDDNGYHIVLEDGSTWETNWWGHFKSQDWNENDTIVLLWETNTDSVEIRNLSTSNSVWGLFYGSPKSDSPYLKKIHSYEDDYSTIVLEDGSRLHSPYACTFLHWQKNETIMTLIVKNKNKSSYGIWNPQRDLIVWELSVN